MFLYFNVHTHERARGHTHTHTHKVTKVIEFQEMFSNWFATTLTLPQAW